ncbi:STOREKEEPER protein-like [Solanum verrucosum]|uniref:STOREKEEPER protein-like n=1 Tax=Solanum verrucosum TaxID=315347 RepID=UPI0020D11987|nr:STOREKEEPER protein-like [Solanum verrucosum]
MSTMYPNGTSFLKENMSLIATDKAKVLEEKWKKLEDDEAALMVKRLDLIAEHYKLVVDAMRVSYQVMSCLLNSDELS